MVGPRDDLNPADFAVAVQRAEAPTMDGRTDIVDAMVEVLRQHRVTLRVDDILDLWTRITADPSMVEAVQDLRATGLRCCLATNQQRQRAAWMKANLGYSEIFDEEFYSCDLGLAKPDPLYFTTILSRLGVAPEEVLFVDDTEVNVVSARELGLHAHLFRRWGGREVLEEILRQQGVPSRRDTRR
ncbi:MAG TPA: HAD-IA family hydrolase, partial [Propionibacteriaceae bacterium]|nr:HAD-IA family hydrolase [Propionibacteriaceae bacterium]